MAGASSDLFLGLDLGTSGCKLIAFDGGGREAARAARSYAVRNPGSGLFELDPDEVWAQAEDCFREVDAHALPGRVATLAISTQGEAIIPIDRAGRALAPAPISADMRGTAAAADLSARFGVRRLYDMTGQPVSPIASLPKLMWWREHRPDIHREAWKFVCFGDFALVRLGLAPVIDPGMAARTMAYDMTTDAWSSDLLGAAGLAPEQMSAVMPSGTIVGTVSHEIAARLRLPDHVAVVVGGHDQPMGALGAGVLDPGVAMYAIGTTEALVVALERPSAALGALNIPCYPHVIPGRFVGLAGSQSGARILAWLRHRAADLASIAAEAGSLDAMLDRLSDAPPTWPLLLPHFAGSGSVLNDATSLGAIYGLDFETTGPDLLRACLEGITLEQALGLETLTAAGVPVETVRAIGGGARSTVWLQMKADILDRPLMRVAVRDAPCLGGAILGRAAVSPERPIAEIAAEMTATAQSFAPRPARARAHAERLALYKDLYLALRPLAPRLMALRGHEAATMPERRLDEQP
ncbi:MAG TPA: FGGY-family carbohydrate kinase [Lichenihabitans sp.]|jgi:xylulokinase|nr:FGGY-family carbohydrate kinase [Lichenihabitans sp.]